jgi:hypothetical protein
MVCKRMATSVLRVAPWWMLTVLSLMRFLHRADGQAPLGEPASA